LRLLSRNRAQPASEWRGLDTKLALSFLLPVAAFPFIFAILISFQRSNIAGFQWSFDLDSWRSIFETGRFGVVLRTLRIGATVALIATAIAVPASYYLCRARPIARSITLALLIAPFFVDLTSRMFALRIALSRRGIVDELLTHFGAPAGSTTTWLFAEPGVFLGLLAGYACASIFPIYLSMSLIHPNLLDAGRSLGCSEWRLVCRVILPLSLPGVGCGFLLCLLYCVGDFVIPSTVSGSAVTLLGSSIQSAIMASRYPVVGALTVILFGWMLGLLALGLLLITLRRKHWPSLGRH
jgi:ABC-type spermidine/putrescine transport system permease subunit I